MDKLSTKEIGDEFELLVTSYYEALGYKVTPNIRIDGHQIDLLATKQVSGAGLFTLMIEAKSRRDTLGINQVLSFMNTAGDLLRNGRIQSAILVTNSKFSQDAQSAVAAKPGMRLSTIHDLEQDLFNYSEALLKIIHDYETRPIYGSYIPLEANDESKHPIRDVASFILNWPKTGEKLLILCGDFGSGKTTALERVHYHQAKLRLQDHSTRLPLSFRLRGLLQYPDLWTFVSASLRDNNYISPTKQIFEKQLAAGKFLILLDGFDEIETGANANERAAHLKTLAPLITSRSPCILATRPTYFDSLNEMRSAFIESLAKPHRFSGLEEIEREIPGLLNKLNIAQNPPLLSPEALKNIVTISRLSNNKLDEYLERYASLLSQKIGQSPNDVRTFLFRTYDLEDLMSRPLLLNMVVETIIQGMLDISSTTSLGPATLYNLYTQLCATRDVTSRSTQFLTSEERLAGCRELATFMFNERMDVIDSQEVLQVIDRAKLGSVTSYPTEERLAALDRAFSDIRVCSFLSFGDDGSLRFAHKSYSEFFVAHKLVLNTLSLPQGSTVLSLIDAFVLRPVGREIIYFLSSFARDNQSFGRLVVGALRETTHHRSETRELLWRIAFASGSLLEALPLTDGNVKSVDLRKARVEGATLNNVQLLNTTIHDLDALEWKLSSCSIGDTAIVRSNFRHSEINIQVLTDSELRSCSFQGGALDIRGSRWILEDSTLEETKARFGGSAQLKNVELMNSSVTISSNLFLLPESKLKLRHCALLGEERKLGHAPKRKSALADHIWYKDDTEVEFDQVLFLGVLIEPVTLASLPTHAPKMILTDCKGIIFFSDPYALLDHERTTDLDEMFPEIMFCNLPYLEHELADLRPLMNGGSVIDRSKLPRTQSIYPSAFSPNSITRQVASWLKKINVPNELESPLSEIAAFEFPS